MTQFKYDLIYILDPNSTSDDIASVAAKVEQITTQASGTVLKKEEWGRRRLSYRVGRHREGIYTFFQIQVDTKTIEEITRNLRLLEKVIKHQAVKEEISRRKPKAPRKKAARPAAAGDPSGRSFPRPAAPRVVSSETAPASDVPTA